MKIDQMKGSRREILLAALAGFEKATKDASKKCEQAFLPTMDADTQVGRCEVAKNSVPLVDSVARDWEATEPIIAVYRNALVVHAREIDKIKDKEEKFSIDTTATEDLLQEIQSILRDHLNDQRDLFAVLEMERNGEAVEGKHDADQISFGDGDDGPPAQDRTKKKSFSEVLREGRAQIPRSDQSRRPKD